MAEVSIARIWIKLFIWHARKILVSFLGKTLAKNHDTQSRISVLCFRREFSSLLHFYTLFANPIRDSSTHEAGGISLGTFCYWGEQNDGKSDEGDKEDRELISMQGSRAYRRNDYRCQFHESPRRLHSQISYVSATHVLETLSMLFGQQMLCILSGPRLLRGHTERISIGGHRSRIIIIVNCIRA